jgi:thiol-disulfide isomerase/thioredoxin
MVTGRTLLLSTFDGDHAFLFQATLMGDSALHGQFWSGKSGYKVWKATRNRDAVLPDADTLTKIVSPDSTFSFDFPEYKGGRIQFPSSAFNGQVVVLQVLGTWCPNCMDETQFLTEWLREKQYKGVQVIGLAFERSADVAKASARVARMATRLQVPYPIAIAGVPDSTASSKIPVIDKIRAYPTTLVVDKNGKVRYVHTGFSGPGTGVYYAEFKDRFDQRITALLKE